MYVQYNQNAKNLGLRCCGDFSQASFTYVREFRKITESVEIFFLTFKKNFLKFLIKNQTCFEFFEKLYSTLLKTFKKISFI